MALTAGQRTQIRGQFSREHLTRGEPCAFSKADLAAAVAAVDDWIDTNAPAYNLALPLGFRTTATVAQKAALLCYVIQRRLDRLAVEG